MDPKPQKKIIACINRRANPDTPSCAARGGVEIAQALEQAIAARGLPVTVERFKCLGLCELGPNLKLSPGGVFFHHMCLADVPKILDEIEGFLKN